MAEASRDQNYVPTLTAASNADGTTPVKVYADPVTHRLLVDLPGGGSGDVTGPASSVDNSVALFNGITGKIIKGDSSLAFDTTIDQLSIGVPTQFTGEVNTPIQIGGSLNGSYAAYMRNTSNGDTASTDLNLGNDIDGEASAGHYIDLGISGSGYVGTAAATGIIKSVSVTAGGTGYTVGNLLTITTGDGTAQVTVLTAPAGVVATVSITENGSGYSIGAGQATTGGSGTGCTINVLTLFDYTIFTANSGYLLQVGGDLVIGTDDTVAAKVIKFHTGGTASTNERARIADTGLQLGLTGTLTGALRFQGATSGTAILTVPTAAGTPTVTLPTTTGTLATLANTETFTNKRITNRVGSTTSSATPTINTDTVDIYRLTAQAVDITSFTTGLTGTPTHGQNLIIEITGTAARAIIWGASFEASTVALPTTTVTTNMLTVGFKWNSATSKWRCLATA